MCTRLPKGTQQGFVASYILYGIALLAMVGLAYGKINAVNEQGRVVENNVSEIRAQVEVLRGKILLCGAIFPEGDHGQFDARHAYPAPGTPNNQALVSVVVCPGSPSGALTLGSLSDGVPLPIAPAEFSSWVYEHTLADGVRLRLVPKVAGGGLQVRERLLRQFGSSASMDGDQLVITVLN